MGRSSTPKYAVRIVTFLSRAGKVAHTPMAWRKQYGRPTAKNLEKWVRQFEESCKPGGCNSHAGYDPMLEATIRVNCDGGEVVATWVRDTSSEPMFQVI